MPVELVFIIMAVILLVSCIIAVESEHFPIFGGGIVVDLMISLWVILSFQFISTYQVQTPIVSIGQIQITEYDGHIWNLTEYYEKIYDEEQDSVLITVREQQCIAGISFSKRYYLSDIIKNGTL